MRSRAADGDVGAPGPSVETGAGVPGYSGGLAAAWCFRFWIFCSWGR